MYWTVKLQNKINSTLLSVLTECAFVGFLTFGIVKCTPHANYFEDHDVKQKEKN